MFIADINDNPPRFPQSTYEFSVPEGSPIDSSVAELQARDEDVDADLTYTLSGRASGYFYMDNVGPTNTGVFKILQVGYSKLPYTTCIPELE